MKLGRGPEVARRLVGLDIGVGRRGECGDGREGRGAPASRVPATAVATTRSASRTRRRITSRSCSSEHVVEGVQRGRAFGKSGLHRRDRRRDVPGQAGLRTLGELRETCPRQLIQLGRRGTGEGVQRRGDGGEARAAVSRGRPAAGSSFVTATAALTSSICSLSRALNHRCTPGSSPGAAAAAAAAGATTADVSPGGGGGAAGAESRPARSSVTASVAPLATAGIRQRSGRVAHDRGHLRRRAWARAVRVVGVSLLVVVGGYHGNLLVRSCSSSAAASSAPHRSRRRCPPGSGRRCGTPTRSRRVSARARGHPATW